jgi:ribosomal protein S18 acetylase RimI-like enzyme
MAKWNDTPLVCDIMVHPAFKNQGLGAFVLKTSAQALFEHGYGELMLYVTEGNANAQHLYAKLGFQIEEQSA